MTALPIPQLKAPFPYFGGKSAVADVVWRALGDTPNYVEPFFGSGAVFLSRPHPHRIATLNDADGLLCNFWRALKHDPGGVTEWASDPIHECDLHARHAWLVGQRGSITARLEGDPDWYDAKSAGWWVWGISSWIGGGWCSGDGPWRPVDGVLAKADGDAGRGIHRKLPHLGCAGRGIYASRANKLELYLRELSARFAVARVCCGDWERVCGPSPTTKNGLTGVFLDPPYGHSATRDSGIYAHDSLDVATRVNVWCVANGDNPLLRIVLAGYDGEHNNLESYGWRVHAWKAHGGMSNTAAADRQSRVNAHRERLWLSPHCIETQIQRSLFEDIA